jgi:hypothetical protein
MACYSVPADKIIMSQVSLSIKHFYSQRKSITLFIYYKISNYFYNFIIIVVKT